MREFTLVLVLSVGQIPRSGLPGEGSASLDVGSHRQESFRKTIPLHSTGDGRGHVLPHDFANAEFWREDGFLPHLRGEKWFLSASF